MQDILIVKEGNQNKKQNKKQTEKRKSNKPNQKQRKKGMEAEIRNIAGRANQKVFPIVVWL